MRLRHPDNSNLILHLDDNWKGLPVLTHRGPLVAQYLDRTHRTLCNAVEEYRRTCAIRFDLRVPLFASEPDSAVISRFSESLKATLAADAARKIRQGRRVHPCRIRIIWVKERESSTHSHYHVCVLLNKDAYFTLGRFNATPVGPEEVLAEGFAQEARANMANRIKSAWVSAIGCDPRRGHGLVHFPENPVYFIDANSDNFYQQFARTFSRLSYFAKAETKHYGDNSNSFGCSRS